MRSHEIEQIMVEARPSRGERVVVFLAPGAGRLAVVASRKVGGAVQRNRARRILRAAWREVSSLAAGRDAVLVARAPIAGATTGELVAEMSELVRRGVEPGA